MTPLAIASTLTGITMQTTQTTQDKIQQRLNLLPDNMLEEVLLFIDFLLSRLTPAPKQSLFDLAGTLPPEDAAQMQSSLEDCSQVDSNEW